MEVNHRPNILSCGRRGARLLACRIIMLMGCWLLSLVSTSCHDRHEQISYATDTNHTLLIYMAGDNTLSKYVDDNIYAMRQGLLDASSPLNLVIYHDCWVSNDNLPVLFQLKRRANSSRTDTVFIKRWSSDHDSTDPAIIREVMRLTFGRFDSDIKGMEFWSHGMSWIPSDNFTVEASATRGQSWVGEDRNTSRDPSHYTELWQLRSAMAQTGIHLDYLMFDACHMATAEVAYELRNQCDYLLAAPSEILGTGFPYRNMLAHLSQVHQRQKLESGLIEAFHDFRRQYPSNGTFTLICSSYLDELYLACMKLNEVSSERLGQWALYPESYENKIQRYGRVDTGARYLFYDLQHWAERLSASNPDANLEEVNQALSHCILASYHSNSFPNGAWEDNIDFTHCCGLALSIPQFFSLTPNKHLSEGYAQLKWQLKVPSTL